MKCQNKQKTSKLLSFILLFLILGCHSENRQKGFFLTDYYYTGDGGYNLEFYKIDDYNEKKILNENLKSTTKIKCFVIPISEFDSNYKFLQYLIKFGEKFKFKHILCYADFEIVDSNSLSYHFQRSDSVMFGKYFYKCDYYFLSMISDKVVFYHFKPIENEVLK
jgi:hypothetical protein